MTTINLPKIDLQYQVLGWALFLHSRSARDIRRHDAMKEWVRGLGSFGVPSLLLGGRRSVLRPAWSPLQLPLESPIYSPPQPAREVETLASGGKWRLD
jgi:hypothetical protein